MGSMSLYRYNIWPNVYMINSSYEQINQQTDSASEPNLAVF